MAIAGDKRYFCETILKRFVCKQLPRNYIVSDHACKADQNLYAMPTVGPPKLELSLPDLIY